jgi:threonine/homoserine/homoserine lactone efflux protein
MFRVVTGVKRPRRPEDRGMPDTSTLALFALSTMGLLLIPGPTVMFIVARSAELGRSAGFVSMLGVEAGALVHVGVATAGLSALVASSPTAFAVLKYGGAAYLVGLGISRLRRAGDHDPATRSTAGRWSLFGQGLLIDLLNPKTALFFLAFLPQFVEPGHGSAALQIAVLGGCFVVLATINDTAYAIAAGALGSRIKRSRARRRVDTGSACVYLALGGLAAAAG